MSLFFFTILKWVQYNHMVLFIHHVKKIKRAAHKNGDVDGMCKRAFRKNSFTKVFFPMPQQFTSDHYYVAVIIHANRGIVQI